MIAARLLSFVDALRKNGVRAAEGEVVDAFRALALVDLSQRDAVRAALSATLAKSASDEEIFERVFALTFDREIGADAPPFADLLRERGVSEEDIEALLRALSLATSNDALLAALLAGDAERLSEAVRTSVDDGDLEGLQSPLQIAYFTQRLLARLGLGALESRFASARALVRRRDQADTLDDDDDALDRATAGAQWHLTERLRRTARRAVERELERRTVARPRRSGGLLDRDLRAVDASEIAELRALVRRLAEKLKARLLARRRRAGRGRIDARRTLRRSIGTDAIPMRVVLMRKRPARPELVVLCDVSDSVRQTSLFMLELVAAISDVLRRSRSFVFVDRIAEVTALFADRSPGGSDPVERILTGDVIAVGASSDYGRALRAFWDAHGTSLSRRTTVMILGDGRSNYRAPEDWILGEMKRRSRRLLWLSPEERGTWGFGDSEMHRYARHADAIYVVRTAADLARAVDRVVR